MKSMPRLCIFVFERIVFTLESDRIIYRSTRVIEMCERAFSITILKSIIINEYRLD